MENNTTLILDVRDRLARIETKFDGHSEAHNVINRRLDKLEAADEALDERVAENRSEIDKGKAKLAALAAVAGALVSLITLLGDRFWHILGS